MNILAILVSLLLVCSTAYGRRGGRFGQLHPSPALGGRGYGGYRYSDDDDAARPSSNADDDDDSKVGRERKVVLNSDGSTPDFDGDDAAPKSYYDNYYPHRHSSYYHDDDDSDSAVACVYMDDGANVYLYCPTVDELSDDSYGGRKYGKVRRGGDNRKSRAPKRRQRQQQPGGQKRHGGRRGEKQPASYTGYQMKKYGAANTAISNLFG